MKQSDTELDDMMQTREFYDRLNDLNVSEIINEHDQNTVQLAKMRLMRYGETNNKFKKELDQGKLSKKYKQNGLINIINKNIQNSEKLMSQFKEPSLYDNGKYSQQRRHQIMKICNDEGAYLNYKKGEISLIDKKSTSPNTNSQVYLKYRQILSLENPGEFVTDPALVVNRLYTPINGTIVHEKRLELNSSQRFQLEQDIIQSKKQRNLEILEKLKDHMESREKLFLKININKCLKIHSKECMNKVQNQERGIKVRVISYIKTNLIADMKEDGLSSPDTSPGPKNQNKDLQIDTTLDFHLNTTNMYDSTGKNQSTAMNTNINNMLNTSLQTDLMMDSRQFSIINKMNRTQNENSVFETKLSPKNINMTGDKSPSKDRKQKYKVPISQVFKYPNYYVWGDPIHKEGYKAPPPQTLQFQRIQFRMQQQIQKQVELKRSPIKENSEQSLLKINLHNQNKPTTPQYFTEPFNQKFKPSTPKFKQARTSQIDSDDYWLNNDYIDKKQNQQRGLSIVESSQSHTNSDLVKIKQFIKQCLKNESDEAERKLQKSLIYESIRHEKLIEVSQFLEDHNEVTAAQLSLFLKKRHSEVESQRQDILESVVDHKLGMMDPSRAAASIEKQANIRKIQGKKLKYNRLSQYS
ncbi:UNKNOWN [Stylonychia lemnae]|uniref:Uncharacterized protein n=1 Tax=Stylonychia lemnae TaxID=5949 RepID=A0A078AD11_STYLE|nr:UNKNOWN [Stylonychia lemnae]|eukprot:CDW80135.1 UNKNOWN [Stylonychia lemnae]